MDKSLPNTEQYGSLPVEKFVNGSLIKELKIIMSLDFYAPLTKSKPETYSSLYKEDAKLKTNVKLTLVKTDNNIFQVAYHVNSEVDISKHSLL